MKRIKCIISDQIKVSSRNNRSKGNVYARIISDQIKVSSRNVIITTNKEAGATLNFCGINENSNERKDSEVVIDFPKHAISVLQFPAGTHHKFSGDFVCLSVHPKEGHNFIKTLQSTGQLPSGFLEYATVFSPGTKKWTERVTENPTQQNVGKGQNTRG